MSAYFKILHSHSSSGDPDVWPNKNQVADVRYWHKADIQLKRAFGGKAGIRIIALGSRRSAQNVNCSCRQNKRRHGGERDER